MSASTAERTTRRELTAAGSDAFQAGSDNLPGVACVWIALEVEQTTIQFGLLGDGQRQPARLGRDAISKGLGKLDSLGRRQLADVEIVGVHALSLPRR